MVKKNKIKTLNIFLYILISTGILVALGIGVYADPVIFGHSFSEIAPPSGCSNNYFLQWTGSDWRCNSTKVLPPEDIIPPVIIFVTSQGAIFSGTVELSAIATDNVGITDIQFYIDNNSIGSPSLGSNSVYSLSWDSTSVIDSFHYFSIIARDSAGNIATDYILITTSNVPEVPNAPLNLRITSSTTAGVGLSWYDNSNSETSFEIWRTQEQEFTGDNPVMVGSTQTDITSYTDYNIIEGQTYWYFLRACNGIYCSSFTSPVGSTIYPESGGGGMPTYCSLEEPCPLDYTCKCIEETVYGCLRETCVYTGPLAES